MKKIFILVLVYMFAINTTAFSAEKNATATQKATPVKEKVVQNEDKAKTDSIKENKNKPDNKKNSTSKKNSETKTDSNIKTVSPINNEKTVDKANNPSAKNSKKTDGSKSSNIEILTKKGFFDKNQNKNQNISPFEEIKRTFQTQYMYSNLHDLNGLSSMYADSYVSEDGFSKDIYFDLVKKTWESYPEISYKLNIKDVIINGNTAVVQVNECAVSKTPPRSEVINQTGLLKSFSETVYYLEKTGNKWLVVTDRVLYEKTFLQYGSAKLMDVNLIAPSQVNAGKAYTATLKVAPEKNTFVIGSIGRELVTYPQVPAKEVFRKISADGSLERMFTANSKDINEYAVASYGITKAEVKDGKEVKITVTGIGFIMQKISVVPKNNFVKVSNEKTK